MKNILFIRLLLASLLSLHASAALAQLIVAHRGASADAPENTISSFQLAWEEGADAIEGDFYLTSDQKIVCIHDDTTERVSGIKLNVANSTLDQLRTLDVGSWKDKRFADERTPSLEDVLATIPFGKRIFIEIKCGPEIVPQLKRVLWKSRLPSQQTKIISSDEEVIHTAKKALPEIEAYWLVRFKFDKLRKLWTPTVDQILATAERINADGLDVQAELKVIDSRFVARCRDVGFSLHAWTVDEPEIAQRLQRLGFESITTNRPGFLLKALAPEVETNEQPRTRISAETPDVEVPSTTLQGTGKE